MKHVLSVLVGTVIVLQGGNCSHLGTLVVDSLVESNRVSQSCPLVEKPFSLVWQEEASEAGDRAKVLFSQVVTLDDLQEILSIAES